MSFDEPNFDDGGEAQPAEESNNNRTFMVAVGILGGIILLSVACLVGVYLFGRNRINGTQQAQANANSTATAAAFIGDALTSTSEALVSLPTTTSTPVPTSATAQWIARKLGLSDWRRGIDAGCGCSTHCCCHYDGPSDHRLRG